jgi:hypothetical protein
VALTPLFIWLVLVLEVLPLFAVAVAFAVAGVEV